MSRLRKQVKPLIKNSDSTPSLFYWTQILTFFENHTTELDIKEVRMLCAECERCRVYWNTEEEKETTVIKNGQKQTLTTVRSSLHIEQEEVNPNIYAYLAEMERQESEEKETAVEEQIPATATA